MPETRLHRGAEHIEQHLRGHADLPAAALLDDRADRDAEEDRKDDDRQEFSLRQRLERIHEEVVDQLQQRAAAPSPETKLLNLPHERRGMFPGIPHARIHEQRESGPEHGGEEGGKKIPGHNPHAETPELPQRQTGAPVTSDRKMIGMTTIFSIAMRTVPNGARTASVPSQTSGPAYRQPIPAAMPSRKAATTR